MHARRHKKQNGFTLIEIMVVVVILGILAAVVVPQIMDRPDTARITKARLDIQSLEGALNQYRLDNFVYPNTEQGLEALVKKPEADPAPANWSKSGYIKTLPKDPWNRPYIYLSPGDKGDFDLYSLGADGQSGGEDANADIVNWSQ